jgi:HSP20 family protein
MTTLVRWDPAAEVDSLQSEMNRIFDGFFGRGNGNGNGVRRWVPAMDLAETDDDLVLTADLPGMSEDDIAIEVRDGVLAISGERRDTHHESGHGYHRAERSFGRFSRTLSLPRGIDAQRVSAKFDQGVLEVHIPKPEERKPFRVRIEGSKGEQPAIEGAGTEK